jgi:hypothetical protein
MSASVSDDGNWTQPKWWGPPSGWFGGVIPRELVLGLSDTAAVMVTHLSVYPTGVAFRLRAFKRPAVPAARIPNPVDQFPIEDSPKIGSGEFRDAADESLIGQSSWEEESSLMDQLKFAVEFEDGRRAERSAPVGGPGDFTIIAFQEGKAVAPDPIESIVLNGRSSSSGPDELVEDRFVWPLPLSGSLAFSCCWSAVGIPERRVELGEAIWREALERAHRLRLAP